MCKLLRFILALGFLLHVQQLRSEEFALNLGKPLSKEEIELYSITIFPDGENLPEGKGSVEQGRNIYAARCANCHGETGIEGPAARLAGKDGWFSISDPLRIMRIQKYPILLVSVGGLWPYATSIFDYVRRAMPHQAPKTLSNDEVYAVTAYILYLNGLLETEEELNQNNLSQITMPGKERSISAW